MSKKAAEQRGRLKMNGDVGIPFPGVEPRVEHRQSGNCEPAKRIRISLTKSGLDKTHKDTRLALSERFARVRDQVHLAQGVYPQI